MASSVATAALSPVLTGAILLALTKAPPNIRDPLLQTLSQYASNETIARTITALKWLFGLGLAKTANTFLSELAQNNWRWSSEKHRYDWPNEIVVVTGAASGFGRLLALDFASHGLKVMALDVHDSLPKDMQSNSRISYYKCDVTDSDAINATAQAIQSQHGHPSILINNAGIGFTSRIVDCKPAQIQKIFGVNIMSHYYTVAAFVPAMISRKKGHVITIASMASFVTSSPIVPYCNTKVAALSFHEGLTSELRAVAPEIKTTCVHPTWARTAIIQGQEEQIKKAGMNVLEPQIIADAIVKQVLSARGGQLIIAPGFTWLANLRAWPWWLSSFITSRSGPVIDEEEKLPLAGKVA